MTIYQELASAVKDTVKEGHIILPASALSTIPQALFISLFDKDKVDRSMAGFVKLTVKLVGPRTLYCGGNNFICLTADNTMPESVKNSTSKTFLWYMGSDALNTVFFSNPIIAAEVAYNKHNSLKEVIQYLRQNPSKLTQGSLALYGYFVLGNAVSKSLDSYITRKAQENDTKLSPYARAFFMSMAETIFAGSLEVRSLSQRSEPVERTAKEAFDKTVQWIRSMNLSRLQAVAEQIKTDYLAKELTPEKLVKKFTGFAPRHLILPLAAIMARNYVYNLPFAIVTDKRREAGGPTDESGGISEPVEKEAREKADDTVTRNLELEEALYDMGDNFAPGCAMLDTKPIELELTRPVDRIAPIPPRPIITKPTPQMAKTVGLGWMDKMLRPPTYTAPPTLKIASAPPPPPPPKKESIGRWEEMTKAAYRTCPFSGLGF